MTVYISLADFADQKNLLYQLNLREDILNANLCIKKIKDKSSKT